MSQVIDDATSAMNDTYDDASTLLDKTVPLGELLDEHLARARENEIFESNEIIETKDYDSPDIPEGYVMDGEVARDFLACRDRDDREKLVCKWKDKSLNTRMQYDPM